MLHSPFGPCLVPDFLHTVIAACVAISGGPKSEDTESGSTKLARVYQMPIYHRARGYTEGVWRLLAEWGDYYLEITRLRRRNL